MSASVFLPDSLKNPSNLNTLRVSANSLEEIDIVSGLSEAAKADLSRERERTLGGIIKQLVAGEIMPEDVTFVLVDIENCFMQMNRVELLDVINDLNNAVDALVDSDEKATYLEEVRALSNEHVGYDPDKDTFAGVGELGVKDTMRIIPQVNALIMVARRYGFNLVYTTDQHTPDHPSFAATYELPEFSHIIKRGMVPAYIVNHAEPGNNYSPIVSVQFLKNEAGNLIVNLPDEEIKNHKKQKLVADPAVIPVTVEEDGTIRPVNGGSLYTDLTVFSPDGAVETRELNVHLLNTLWTVHGVKGTRGAEFANGLLRPRPGIDKVIEKGTEEDVVIHHSTDFLSAISQEEGQQSYITELGAYLLEKNPKVILTFGIMDGVCASGTGIDIEALTYQDNATYQLAVVQGLITPGQVLPSKTAFVPQLSQAWDGPSMVLSHTGMVNRHVALAAGYEVDTIVDIAIKQKNYEIKLSEAPQLFFERMSEQDRATVTQYLGDAPYLYKGENGQYVIADLIPISENLEDPVSVFDAHLGISALVNEANGYRNQAALGKFHN